MRIYPSVKFFPCKFVDGLQNGHVQIHHPSALCAEDMIVRRRNAVKTVAAVGRRDFYCFSDISQEIQIPVYSAKTDVWKFFPYMQVNGIGGRMFGSTGKKFFNGFSLPAVF